jgi:hypothetical protein
LVLVVEVEVHQQIKVVEVEEDPESTATTYRSK